MIKNYGIYMNNTTESIAVRGVDESGKTKCEFQTTNLASNYLKMSRKTIVNSLRTGSFKKTKIGKLRFEVMTDKWVVNSRSKFY